MPPDCHGADLALLQVDSLTSWLTGKEAQQGKLEGHEDPALHSSEVTSRVGEVWGLCFSEQQKLVSAEACVCVLVSLPVLCS